MSLPPDVDPDYVAELLEQARKRGLIKASVDPLRISFPRQRQFIEDNARLKAALCTRRSGKTVGAALYMLREAYSAPDTNCLYVALTRQQVKGSMWQELKKKARELGVYEELNFHETELTVTLPNRSVIYLMGLDTSADQQERVRGNHFKLIVVDEAGSFRHDLHAFVEETLRPLTWDDEGTICLLGTPRNIKNFFHGVTTGEHEAASEWSVHRWQWADNPHMADKVQREVARILEKRPLFKDTPQYRQEYCGEWAINDDMLVYKFDEQRNTIDALPLEPREYRYVIGMDLGFTDATSWVVVAWSKHDDTLYVVEVKKERKVLPDRFVEVTRELRSKYTFDAVPPVLVGDNGGLGKPLVEHLQDKLRVPVRNAKGGRMTLKADSTQLLSGDLIVGRIKLLPGCEPLSDEWVALTWDERELERSGRFKENAACDNHAADAMLYAWRQARNQNATAAPGARPEWGTDEWEQENFERHLQRIRSEGDTDSYWFGEDDPT